MANPIQPQFRGIYEIQFKPSVDSEAFTKPFSALGSDEILKLSQSGGLEAAVKKGTVDQTSQEIHDWVMSKVAEVLRNTGKKFNGLRADENAHGRYVVMVDDALGDHKTQYENARNTISKSQDFTQDPNYQKQRADIVSRARAAKQIFESSSGHITLFGEFQKEERALTDSFVIPLQAKADRDWRALDDNTAASPHGVIMAEYTGYYASNWGGSRVAAGTKDSQFKIDLSQDTLERLKAL